MQKTLQKMKQLGFSEKEGSIYFFILRQQRVRISQIVKSTNIKRSSVYYAVDKLIEKGLVIQVVQEDKKYYIPEDAKNAFNNLVLEQKNIVSNILPGLKNIIGDNFVQPKIKTYRHKEGIKKMMWTILNSQEKLVRYYLQDPGVENFIGKNFLNKFTEKRISLGIKVKTLRSFEYKPEREKGKMGARELREVRYLPEKIKIKPSMSIFDNKIIVISPKEKLGFVIESKDFAEAQKIIFDLLWESVS